MPQICPIRYYLINIQPKIALCALRALAARLAATATCPNTRVLLGPLPAAALDQSSVSIQGSVVRKLSNFKYIDFTTKLVTRQFLSAL